MPPTTPSIDEETPSLRGSQRGETLDEARDLGRQAGQLFDLRLREAEAAQRESRLTEGLWKPESPAGRPSEESSYELMLLRTRVEELSYYLKAVESSVAWRAVQWVRGLFGRAW